MGLQPTADLKKSLAVFSNNIHSKNIQIETPKLEDLSSISN